MASILAPPSPLSAYLPPSRALPWRSLTPRTAAFWGRSGSGQGNRAGTRQTAAVPPWPSDLSPPPIDLDLLEAVAAGGAQVSEDGIIQTFDNDDEAVEAFYNGVVLLFLEVTGDDRIPFLHNQSTSNFECLYDGQGCDTVFVTPTARSIDIAHAWIMRNSVLLVVSPETCTPITQLLNKYIFFADKVEIHDITKKTSLFMLSGPHCHRVMNNLNLDDLVGQPYGTHRHYSVNGTPVTIGVGNYISEDGYSILMSPAAAGSVWKTLLSQGACAMGSNALERLRVMQGRPAPGKDLTNEFNVLEAGLWTSISLNKGCYKGQETIARLITYDGVKQRLLGLQLSAPAEPGTLITADGAKVGKLTSYAYGRRSDQHYGLGYIRRNHASVGELVLVGDKVVGTLVEPPFLARQRPPSNKSTS